MDSSTDSGSSSSDELQLSLLPASQAASPAVPRRQWLLASLLFLLTLATTTTLAPVWYASTRTDVITDLDPWLTPEVVVVVWGNPHLVRLGLSVALPLLFILGCHELGHLAACRLRGIPCSPPFFLPLPMALGTAGAFIRLRAPIRSRRELVEMAAAGPLAGFAALLPLLVYGISRSTPTPLPPHDPTAAMALFVPGRCLAVEGIARLFHGPLPADTVLDLHPFALAGWFGLLATAFNLLPLGQLDGGHLAYAALGARQRRLARPLWLALATLGFLSPAWWLPLLLVLVLGLRHPPVRDEAEPLDWPRRLLVGASLLLLLLLCFMPRPLRMVAINVPAGARPLEAPAPAPPR